MSGRPLSLNPTELVLVCEALKRRRRLMTELRELSAKLIGARHSTLGNGRLDAAIIWLCVPDSQIASVSSAIGNRWTGNFAFHSSGALASQHSDASTVCEIAGAESGWTSMSPREMSSSLSRTMVTDACRPACRRSPCAVLLRTDRFVAALGVPRASASSGVAWTSPRF